MPFYAYIQDEENDFYRYLITFADRETADEWWRMVSTPPSPYIASFRRITPQFYSQSNANRINVANFFSHTALPDARQLYRKMFVTWLYKIGDKLPFTIPPIQITDHISGRWYFIRSQVAPSSYWYLRTKGACLVCGDAQCDAVHVSSEYRTKFCVRISGSDNIVMIGRDKIFIAAPGDFTVHINAAQDLKATKAYQGTAPELLFDHFKDRFITRTEKQVSGEIWEYVELVENGLGETWELVN